jgi:alkanesulfonate monooxygenase SsuD/methylene tetrahydromethanopterin reductase-like flavin-dependent oxidoreductase (luciferase family)
MKFGVFVSNFGDYSDFNKLLQLARETESAGWDGFFLWDQLLVDKNITMPVADPWIALAAIAATTKRLRIGPLVTPLARRRPWKVARETISLDHLSGGRTVLGVGSGGPPEVEFGCFGEETDDKVRAKKLDEALDVVTGLWSGESVCYSGEYFRIDGVRFLPQPVQRPRIPIWVGGMLPNKAPFRRAARWDGVFPLKVPPQGVSGGDLLSEQELKWESFWLNPDELREVVTFVNRHRQQSGPFDFVASGATPTKERGKASEKVTPFEKVGATWWLEWLEEQRGTFEQMEERVAAGPPRI